MILDKLFIWLISLRFLDRMLHTILISYKEGQGFLEEILGPKCSDTA